MHSINTYPKGCGTLGVPVFATENIELTRFPEMIPELNLVLYFITWNTRP